MWQSHIWKCILSIAKNHTSTEQTNKSFNCFLNSIYYLLPSEQDKFVWLQCMKINKVNFDYPFDSLFNVYINYMSAINIVPLLQKKDFDTITKDFWGNATWYTIHFLASVYTPSKETKNAFKAMLVCLRYILPCKNCRENFANNLSKNPIDSFLLNRNTLFLFTFNLHNIVNKELDKPIFDYNVARKKFSLSFL